MEQPTCKTCPYWHHPDPDEEQGWCRKRCPAIVHDQLQHGGSETNAYEAVWPDVRFDDWCGEHPDFPAYLASRRGQQAVGMSFGGDTISKTGTPISYTRP